MSEKKPTSWWLEQATREQFQAAAEREALRIRLSKEAAKMTPMIVGYRGGLK